MNCLSQQPFELAAEEQRKIPLINKQGQWVRTRAVHAERFKLEEGFPGL